MFVQELIQSNLDRLSKEIEQIKTFSEEVLVESLKREEVDYVMLLKSTWSGVSLNVEKIMDKHMKRAEFLNVELVALQG